MQKKITLERVNKDQPLHLYGKNLIPPFLGGFRKLPPFPPFNYDLSFSLCCIQHDNFPGNTASIIKC